MNNSIDSQKNNVIRFVECPRDAMQGWKSFIPTEKKVEYLNALLKVGFDTLDFGSFVSPKAIPQMADTKEVIGNLELVGIISLKCLSQFPFDFCVRSRYDMYPLIILKTISQ